MEELHRFNTTFAVLKKCVTEIMKHTEEGSTRTTMNPERNMATERDMKLYKRTRSASTRLYSTFASRWSCSIHERHIVSICPIDDNNNTSITQSTKFVLAMRTLDDSTFPEDTMWLDVIHTEQQERLEEFTGREDSRVNQFENAENQKLTKVRDVVPLLEKSSQKFVAELPVQKKRKLRKIGQKMVHFHPNIPLEISELDERAATEDHEVELGSAELTLNLRTVDDYCFHFQNGCRQYSTQKLLGYLSECYVQRFYRLSPLQNAHHGFCSLHDLIKNIFENPIERATTQANVAMGRSLAEIVLQFYSTPWLPPDWTSGDIYLFGDPQNFGLQGHWRKPYLALNFVKCGDHDGKGKKIRTAEPLGPIERRQSHQSSLIEASSFVRNGILFRLGIILLEIGYSKPWEVLRQEVSHHKIDYFAALHLAIDLEREAGTVYARITRKCLSCDFGVKDIDLEHESLQREFVSQVISGLGTVERQVATLWE